MIPSSSRKREPELKQMLFRTYTVNGIKYYVTGYDITDLYVSIITDVKTFNIIHANLEKMLNMFIEVATEDVTEVAVEQVYEETEEHDSEHPPLSINQAPRIEALSASREIKDILMDSLRKVAKDRNYIHQASAVNETVKTLMEFARTEIQAQELSLKMTGGNNGRQNKQLS